MNYISLRKAKTYMAHFPKVKYITASPFSPTLGVAEPTRLIVFISCPYLDGNCGSPCESFIFCMDLKLRT